MCSRLLFFCFVTCLLFTKVVADESLETRAIVKALKRAVISGEIAGRIKDLPKKAGEFFSAGEMLVAFDCALFVAQWEKVTAEREAAEAKLKNDRLLESMRSIGALEVALSEAELKKVEAELRIARLTVKRCTIKAPYDGRIVQVMTNEYESVRQQQALLEIIGMGHLEAEIVIPSHWLSWLKVGSPLTMRIDETGDILTAKVIAVGATIDPVSQTTNVRAQFVETNSRLVPGMSGTVQF